MSEIDINAIVQERQVELEQCERLVRAVENFIVEFTGEWGADLRLSDAFSIVSMALRSSAEKARQREDLK